MSAKDLTQEQQALLDRFFAQKDYFSMLEVLHEGIE